MLGPRTLRARFHAFSLLLHIGTLTLRQVPETTLSRRILYYLVLCLGAFFFSSSSLFYYFYYFFEARDLPSHIL